MCSSDLSGAAALLFSLKPAASVTEVRYALLSSVTPDPSLLGRTSSGGRLELPGALYTLQPPPGAQPPDTRITAAPPATSHSEKAEFSFERVGGGAAAFECRIVAVGPWKSCPGSYSLGEGTHVFQVRASAEGMTDPLPASYVWTIEPPLENAQLPKEGDEDEAKPPMESGSQSVLIPAPEEQRQGSGPAPAAPPASACLVPRLAGLKLARARTVLAEADCALGAVRKPKRHRGRRLPALVVRASTPRAGSETDEGTVGITLGPKPGARHKHR